MPLLSSEKIDTPIWQFNGHLQTILPNLRRKVDGVLYQRERINTWDDDFLDLDWSTKKSKTLVILSHGLAGSSDAAYIKGFVRLINQNGWDALAWNYRGCSGEPNKHIYSFHAGKTDDLAWVIKHAHQTGRYDEIHLVGISMGGNITLKLLGEWGEKIPYPIKKAIAISTPVDMFGTSLQLIKGWNKIYSNRYMRQYKEMLKLKEEKMPNVVDFQHIYQSDNLHTYVERFTAPSFGFKDAQHYLESQSALQYIPKISVPSLLMNADNDPFLTKKSFPEQEARQSSYFYFLKTINGGHVGFDEKTRPHHNWMERRSMEFLVE